MNERQQVDAFFAYFMGGTAAILFTSLMEKIRLAQYDWYFAYMLLVAVLGAIVAVERLRLYRKHADPKKVKLDADL